MISLKEYVNKHKALTLILCLALCFWSGFFGAYYFNNTQSANAEINKSTDVTSSEIKVEKVNTTTKFIYIRKFTKSQTVNIEEKTPPENLIGADETAVSIAMTNWKLESFTAERVTFSKEIDSYSPCIYKISSIMQDNQEYLCVYEYDIEGNEKLKTTYDTPIAVFDETEIARIRNGIIVIWDNALNKALENYAE